ncbi:hypothetical protein FSP39_007495 [Pinctada imbricata]|uniref:DED domain-containing protein n=1 Tax=Pinctada imbricata TaxID=66713 RepID=A0AA88Y5W0_PINIB|nr:hypothetical protein FSP39_007495 [Pinctada imbricata]
MAAASLVQNINPPSGDFKLNVFLGKIADELTEDDFKMLKFYCSGPYGIGKRALEQMTSPLDLFRNLQERELLNMNNILVLQSMLWHLPRIDLQQQFVEFGQSLENTLHFTVPKDTPENGYKYLKFHVYGKTLDNFDRVDLETMRSNIASNLLHVPPQFVVFEGIEMSNSLIITIMVQEDFAIFDLKSNPRAISSLTRLSIDAIFMDGKSFAVSGDEKMSTKTANVMESELHRIQRRYEEKELQVDKLEMKLKDCRETISRKEKQLEEFRTSMIVKILVELYQYRLDIYMITLTYTAFMRNIRQPIWPLKRLSVSTIFKTAMKKVKSLNYDSDVISNLLDAQALLLQWHQRTNLDVQNNVLQQRLIDLENRAIFTEYERNKLAYYHGIGEKVQVLSERDEFLVMALVQRIPISAKIQGPGYALTPEIQEAILKSLAKELKKSEVKKLLKNHPIEEDMREKVEHSTFLLLDYLLKQENKRVGGAVNLHEFFTRLFQPLGRPELVQAVGKCITKSVNPTPENKRGKEADAKEEKKEKQRHTSKEDTTMKDILSQLQSMNQRLEKIENSKSDQYPWSSKAPNENELVWASMTNLMSKFKYLGEPLK